MAEPIAIIGPAITGPAVTGPAVTGPAVTGPAATGPAATGAVVSVGASVGVACGTPADAERMLRDADAQMYHNKQSRKASAHAAA